MSLYTPLIHPKNSPAPAALRFGPLCIYAAKSHVVPQCSKEVSASKVNHIHSYQFPYPCHSGFVYYILSLSCNCFLSMMGDTSRLSFDGSFPVNFNTSAAELELETRWYLGNCMPQWDASSLSIVGLHH